MSGISLNRTEGAISVVRSERSPVNDVETECYSAPGPPLYGGQSCRMQRAVARCNRSRPPTLGRLEPRLSTPLHRPEYGTHVTGQDHRVTAPPTRAFRASSPKPLEDRTGINLKRRDPRPGLPNFSAKDQKQRSLHEPVGRTQGLHVVTGLLGKGRIHRNRTPEIYHRISCGRGRFGNRVAVSSRPPGSADSTWLTTTVRIPMENCSSGRKPGKTPMQFGSRYRSVCLTLTATGDRRRYRAQYLPRPQSHGPSIDGCAYNYQIENVIEDPVPCPMLCR